MKQSILNKNLVSLIILLCILVDWTGYFVINNPEYSYAKDDVVFFCSFVSLITAIIGIAWLSKKDDDNSSIY